MSDLKKLPEYSERILHNLYADNNLKSRIIAEASKPEKPASIWSGRFMKAVPAFVCAAVLLAVLAALNPIRNAGKPEILDFPAGEVDTVSNENKPFDTIGKAKLYTY